MRLVTAALISALIAAPAAVAQAATDGEVERLVARELKPIVPADGAGGVAVAARIAGRTLFFNYGFADLAAKRPVTTDSLFNLGSIRKVFEATLLAQAVKRGELTFDDPVAKYVVELQRGGDIRKVTLGHLATHTSGLSLPSDYPPGPERPYTLSDFIHILNAWKLNPGWAPGEQHTYTHAGYVLLQLALERRFGTTIGELFDRRLLAPLGMTSTVLGTRGADGRGELPPALIGRAVQGYSKDGEPIGGPGDQQVHFDIAGAGQVFSSARDMATFLAADLGELPIERGLQEAMQFSQQGVFKISPRNTQAPAWEVNDYGGPVIVDKPGGLDHSSIYIGMVPAKRLGIVILANRGFQHPHEIARQSLLPALARD
jgi:beta-lactamase class C